MTTKTASGKPEYPIVIETFRKVNGFELSNLKNSEPKIKHKKVEKCLEVPKQSVNLQKFN